MPLPQLPPDKANHFLYGAIAAAVCVPIGAYFGLPSHVSALGGSAIVGALKEAADAIQNALAVRRGEIPMHSVDFFDFLATACGGLSAASVGVL